MKKLTCSEVFAKLLAAADALRGTVRDPFDLLAGLVILKRAHDQPGFLRTPHPSPWVSLISGDRSRLGSGVTEAFRELGEMNKKVFKGALQFIDGNRVSDPELWGAVQILDGVSLADEALEFTDTLGKAFEMYLVRYAELQGKRGSGFYTPPSVSELMVRLVEPVAGHSLHDPFAGAGGMLIYAREFVEEREGSGASLRLFGQEVNQSVCARARLNLLLHGIADAELRHGDSLTDPAFLVDGRQQEFDRVLCNPPFSVRYDEKSINLRERMKYGWASPAHADLMNIQHAMASLRPTGRGAVVAPHGVLFRGGADGAIRRGIVESERLVAVIGIGANVFYGTSVPACVLVFDGEDRGGRPPGDGVLFINAEREIVSGRTQNRLEPQNIEMIVDVFRSRAELSGFSRFVSLEEIAANDHILSIRMYVDSQISSAPLPDVRAMLSGGVPKSEVQADAERFHDHGIDVEDLFREKDVRYYDFLEEGWEFTAARLPELGSMRKNAVLQQCSLWWESSTPRLASLRAAGKLLAERDRLTVDFTAALRPVGLLDQYRLAGVFASWWASHKDDLRRPERPIEALGDSLCAALAQRVAAELQQLVTLYRSWGERYGTSLADLDNMRAMGAVVLARRLGDLGFRSS
ncbi:N-6 DNA methylase [Nonomuraea cavernae]|uniref:N-6 DNA methylase n=1 Tax=Nonomuraea cavernae TaxID=2045107 RepID=UPI0033C14083